MESQEPPVFDVVNAMDRVDQDRALLQELVQLFFADWQVNLEKIRTLVSAGDLAEAGRLAHAVKSALGNLGAMQAYHCAYRIELAGKSGNKDSMLRELQLLPTYAQTFQKESSRFFTE